MDAGSRDRPELPSGWAWATIPEFADHCLGKMLDAGKRRAGQSLPYLRNINVRWGGFDLRELVAMPFEEREFERYGIKDGDVLICEGGEPGRCAVWRQGSTDLKLQKALHRVRCEQGVVPEFIAYQLMHLCQNGRLANFFTGTTISHLPGVALRNVPFKLAPSREQARIASRIDELFGEIEAGEQELEKAREALETYRRAILKAAVTGELTKEWRENHAPSEGRSEFIGRILRDRRAAWEINTGKHRYQEPNVPDTSDMAELPNGWVWASVEQLCWHLQYGSSAKCTAEPLDVPVLRMGNIKDGLIDYSTLKFLPADHPEFPDLLLKRGDVLFNRTNSAELVGKSAVYNGSVSPCSFASYLIRLKLVGVLPEYFCYYLNSHYGRAWVAANKSQQVGQANLSGGKLKSLCVPVPSSDEQQEIVRRVNASFDAVRELEADPSIWVASTNLRRSILSAAFSGRLVSQDFGDEPASMLLGRLQAGKSAVSDSTRNSRVRRYSGDRAQTP